jgi:hypothetical protein
MDEYLAGIMSKVSKTVTDAAPSVVQSKGKLGMKTDLNQELLKATGEKPQGKAEDRQKFLKRIAVAVDRMTPSAYNKLTEEAAGWYEKAVVAAGEGAELPDFVTGKTKPGLKFNGEEKEGKISFKKKTAEPELPSWEELTGMSEKKLAKLAEEHEVDLDSDDIEDLDDARKALADALKIERPKKAPSWLKAGKKNGKAKDDDGEPVLTWGAIHKMNSDKLEEVIDEHNIKIPRSAHFETLKDARDFVCEKLGIEKPEHVKNAPRELPPRKHTGTEVKDNPAEKRLKKKAAEALKNFKRTIASNVPKKYREKLYAKIDSLVEGFQ